MSNDEYPGREMGGKYCANCHWPIDENGDCNCGWNHISKQKINNRTMLLIPQELKKDGKNGK